MSNPLLTPFLLPPFSTIFPEHIMPAIQSAINHCRQTINQVLSETDEFSWSNLCQPIADADDYLGRILSPIIHLNSVNNTPELRIAYEEILPILSEYTTWVGQHRELYEAYRKLFNSENYDKLDIAQKKSIDNILRDFKLSGICLPKNLQNRYSEIIFRLFELDSIYSNNVLDATMSWNKLINNVQELSGIPENVLSSTRRKAQEKNQDGWLITLNTIDYLPSLTYCDNDDLRKELYYAYNTRASDQGPNAGRWDNGPIIKEILKLRHELAELLGFKNYVEQSLVKKMAIEPQEVLDFLNNLANRVRLQGKREFSSLCKFVKKHFSRDILNPWDINYFSEKQKQYLFSINDEILRPYFPEKNVLNGLFDIVNRIYGITVKESIVIDTWNPSVRFFDIFDEYNEKQGSLYLDLYARNNKRSGAWMDNCVNLIRKSDGTLQKPVAYLVCNFSCPANGQQSLFTHNEVITLFHEFGHCLHHILTSIETPGVSGINNIPWDAVELPSQFMENFCWQPEAIQLISRHYKTGETLPDKLLNNLLKTKNYQSAMFILRQLELSLFDFYIHYQYNVKEEIKILEKLKEIKKQISVVPTSEWMRFPNTFNHIFSGNYAAGYYSYLWADVLAADAWSRFEEDGIFNRETGNSFLKNILSRGGSEDPIVLFTRFRGRKPQINAMLRHNGIQ